MLDAPPQPAVLATSAASYLVAPAAGRRVTAWMEFPAARATSPDAVARRRANRLVIANRDGRRVQVVYDGGCSLAQPCDTVAAPFAGADTVLYAVADGRHANLASASLQRRPSRLVAQMAQPAGRRAAAVHARRPRGRLVHRERPARAPARHLGAGAHADRRADRRPGARGRAPRARDGLARAHRRGQGRGLRAARRRARRDALHARSGRACG